MDVIGAAAAQGAVRGTHNALDKVLELRDIAAGSVFNAYLAGADDVELEDVDEMVDDRTREQRARSRAEGIVQAVDVLIRSLCTDVEFFHAERERYIDPPPCSLAAALVSTQPELRKVCAWR